MFPVLSFRLGELTFYLFGLILTFGALLSLTLLYMGEKRMSIPRGSAPGLFLLSGLCGFAGSRLVYALTHFSRLFYDDMEGSFLGLSPLFQIASGGHSIYGFIAGALLGMLLFSKFSGQDRGSVFARSAAPLGAFISAAFFAQIAGGSGWGEEAPAFFQFIPLAIRNPWGEWNLAVFFYEGIWALLLTLWLKQSRRQTARPGNRMLMLLIPLAAMQIFFESLRQDDYPRLESNAFIRVNQLLALLMLVIMLWIMFRRLSAVRKAGNVVMLLLASAAFIAVEFWEKLPMQKEALYAASFVMALALSFVWLNNLRKAKV